MASGTPVMSFSKQNDATNFLYTIFPQYWNPWGGYMMQNKYHPWNTAAFKGEKHVVMTCNDEEKIKTFTNKHIATTHITAYPNPFSTMLGLSIPNENQNDDATISVTDITGKGYGNYNGKLINANSYLTTLSKTLVPGQYTININIDGKSAQSLKITKTE
jgi:hypothetical protein